MRSLRLLFTNLDGLRRSFLLIAVFSIVDGFASFLIPVVLAEVSPTAPLSEAPRWIAIIFGLFFGSLGCQWVLRRYAEELGPRFAIRLRRRYFEALRLLSLAELRSIHSAYVLSLISRAADGLGAILTRVLWGWIRSVIALGLFVYFSAQESMMLAFLNAVIILGFTAASTALSRRILPLISGLNEKNSKLFAAYADFASNAATVKRLGIGDFADRTLDSAGREAEAQLSRTQSFHAWRWFLLHSLYGLAFLTTLCFLFYKTLSGASSPAPLILFIAAFASLRIHAEAISEDFKAIIEIDAALKPLSDLCPLREDSRSSPVIPEFLSMELKAVKFRWNEDGAAVSVPELKIQHGDRILITGESGAGKSTLLAIISGLLRPNSGEILINSRLSQSPDERLCAAASQDAELFSMSIYDNLCLGRAIPREEIMERLSELRLSDWVTDLPKGLDTEVGEKGARVSAGQRQRLNLIRASFMDRPIYILDEPTSNLDAETEKAAVKFIQTRLPGQTVIIVSHREIFGDFVNKRYRMEGGVLLPE